MLQQPDTQLLAYLEAGVPGPRHKRGQRYEWRFLLAMICVALMSGQQTVRGMVRRRLASSTFREHSCPLWRSFSLHYATEMGLLVWLRQEAALCKECSKS